VTPTDIARQIRKASFDLPLTQPAQGALYAAHAALVTPQATAAVRQTVRQMDVANSHGALAASALGREQA
jgi:hypothetical protein